MVAIINYARHRRKLEKTYEDRVTVQRIEKVKVNGETKQQLVGVYEQQPCRISQKTLGTNGQTESTNNTMYETKLFIAPELEIKQGDSLTVSRGQVTREYTAGESFVYASHQEISIQRKDKA